MLQRILFQFNLLLLYGMDPGGEYHHSQRKEDVGGACLWGKGIHGGDGQVIWLFHHLLGWSKNLRLQGFVHRKMFWQNENFHFSQDETLHIFPSYGFPVEWAYYSSYLGWLSECDRIWPRALKLVRPFWRTGDVEMDWMQVVGGPWVWTWKWSWGKKWLLVVTRKIVVNWASAQVGWFWMFFRMAIDCCNTSGRELTHFFSQGPSECS